MNWTGAPKLPVARPKSRLLPRWSVPVPAFLITASAFGALSLWGYTTKRNLGGIGNFAVMALWGVVALSLLNFILPPSSMFEWIIMAAVFGLSAILIAVETQQLKEGYYSFGGDARSLAVMTNWGALNFFISLGR